MKHQAHLETSQLFLHLALNLACAWTAKHVTSFTCLHTYLECLSFPPCNPLLQAKRQTKEISVMLTVLYLWWMRSCCISSELDCQTQSQGFIGGIHLSKPLLYIYFIWYNFHARGKDSFKSGAEAAASAAGYQSTTHTHSYLLYIVACFSASLNKHYI